jgi:hypothetical protein
MHTHTFTVNNLSSPEQIIARTGCRRITVGEDPSVAGWPTTDFKITGKVPGSTVIQRPAGTTFTFERNDDQASFGAGDLVAYIETVDGSTTFLQTEQ